MRVEGNLPTFRWLITTLLLLGCNGGNDAAPTVDAAGPETDATIQDAADVFVLSTAISGAVQKGPFVRGSSLTVQELDATLTPTGKSFSVTTMDDEGAFTVPVNVASRYVEVIASGYYFDEFTNQLSTGQLTLRALADLSAGATVDLNLLTSMSEPLVRKLVARGAAFSQAQTQAEASVLIALGFSPSLGSSFSNVTLTGTGSSNAEVLAASLIVQQYARSRGGSESAQLSQLLGEIGAATAEAGGDSTLSALQSALCSTIWAIDAASVRAHLTAYYASLGASVTIPPFEQYLCGCGLVCNGACVNHKTDPNNCGMCGNKCPMGASCQNGMCPQGCVNPPDQPTDGVRCGTQMCTGATAACCRDQIGGPGLCVSTSVGFCPQDGGIGSAERCDGPEDCPSGQMCLSAPGTYCGASASGAFWIVCHADKDCPSDLPICSRPQDVITGVSPRFTERVCTRLCTQDSDCDIHMRFCYADPGCGLTCHLSPRPTDAGTD